MKLAKMSKGGIIFFEDKRDTNVYILKKGKVELRKKEGYFLSDGVLKNHFQMREGDVFGFEELFLKRERETRAIAVEDSEILLFGMDEFSEVIKGNIKIGEKILNSLAGRIRSLNNRIRELCKDENTAEEAGELRDIYCYFVNTSDFKKAMDVLLRIKDMAVEATDHEGEKYDSEQFIKELIKRREFSEQEIKRLEYVMQAGITNEKIDKIIEMYIHTHAELLYYVLNGLKVRVAEQEIFERIILERNKLLLNFGKNDEFIKATNEFIVEFPNSIYKKSAMFLLMQEYDRAKKTADTLQTANALLDEIPEGEELKKIREVIERVGEKEKGEGNV